MEDYDPWLKGRARELRGGMTDAEQLLWRRVRRKQIAGLQFYRQKPIAKFIVDFYCPAAKLVIEVDGRQHLEREHAARDRERDARLNTLGLRVLRFDNRAVLLETEAVLEVIWRAVKEIPPDPPFTKGGVRQFDEKKPTPFLKRGEDGSSKPETEPTPSFKRGRTAVRNPRKSRDIDDNA